MIPANVDAAIAGIYVRTLACEARMRGMEAANHKRREDDKADAYDENSFFIEAEKLDAIAAEAEALQNVVNTPPAHLKPSSEHEHWEDLAFPNRVEPNSQLPQRHSDSIESRADKVLEDWNDLVFHNASMGDRAMFWAGLPADVKEHLRKVAEAHEKRLRPKTISLKDATEEQVEASWQEERLPVKIVTTPEPRFVPDSHVGECAVPHRRVYDMPPPAPWRPGTEIN